MKKILTLIILAFSTLAISANAQEDNPRIGLFGSYNLYQHTADFRTLPGVVTCCPKFIDGDGTGFSLGFLFEYPLRDGLFFAVRAGALKTSAQFSTDEPDTVNLNGSFTRGIFRHIIDADFSDIAVQPQIQWRFWNRLMFHAGFELALGKFGNGYSHSEQIIEPTVGTYENDKRTRLLSSGPIDNMNMLNLSLFGGLSYEFVLNRAKTWFLAPEAMFFFGLQDNVKDINWKTNSFRFGLALKYSPVKSHLAKDYFVDTIRVRSNKYTIPSIVEGREYSTERTEYADNNEKIIIKEIRRTDTLFTPLMFAKITTTSVNDLGVISKVSDIHVSTQFVTEVFPVLPYIFFDKNASKLPARYESINNSGEFTIEKLDPDPVHIQRNVLNIIGRRMNDIPTANLTLLGASDPTSENGDCNLANSRAQVVRNYLMSVWGIPESRITLKALNEPCVPSAITQTQTEDGFADNRRVEISSNNPDILASLSGKKFNEPYKITPPVIVHDPTGSTTEDVVNWLIVGTQGNKEIFTKSGEGAPIVIEHKISNKTAMEISDEMPLQLTFVIKDKSGNTATATEEFNISKDTSETEIKRLSLTVFEVGSAEVTKSAGTEIKDFIKDLDPEAEISITGYTDKLGNPDFNRNLASNRANSITDYIKRIAPSSKISSTRALAFTNYPPGIYSYDTPEERFLSRTVQIEIKQKIRK